MARLTRCVFGRDVRGVVYVEFLLAFFPLFLLFLGICQLALLASARLVVQHAAQAAVRSAVVILDEEPKAFGDAPRGDLSRGRGGTTTEAVLSGLGVNVAGSEHALPGASPGGLFSNALAQVTAELGKRQSGARMAAIRAAAYLPLLALSPRPGALQGPAAQSLGESLPDDFANRMQFGLDFLRAASVVTVHDAPESEALAVEPVDSHAPVTVRVTYLFPCGVPVARMLACKTLEALLTDAPLGVGLPTMTPRSRSGLAKRLALSEAPGGLDALAEGSARFVVLTAEATLPNQGANYHQDKAAP